MKHQSSHQCSQIIPESESKRTHGRLCFVKGLNGKPFNECSADSSYMPLIRDVRS